MRTSFGIGYHVRRETEMRDQRGDARTRRAGSIGSRTQALMFVMWADRFVGIALGIRVETRPAILPRVIDPSCPHRIEFDIAVARQ